MTHRKKKLRPPPCRVQKSKTVVQYNKTERPGIKFGSMVSITNGRTGDRPLTVHLTAHWITSLFNQPSNMLAHHRHAACWKMLGLGPGDYSLMLQLEPFVLQAMLLVPRPVSHLTRCIAVPYCFAASALFLRRLPKHIFGSDAPQYPHCFMSMRAAGTILGPCELQQQSSP